MKRCNDCKHAEWERTAKGRLHPSGDGKCRYPYKVPPLPACMQWPSMSGKAPSPSFGYINRREELKEHCVYYERGKA